MLFSGAAVTSISSSPSPRHRRRELLPLRDLAEGMEDGGLHGRAWSWPRAGRSGPARTAAPAAGGAGAARSGRRRASACARSRASLVAGPGGAAGRAGRRCRPSSPPRCGGQADGLLCHQASPGTMSTPYAVRVHRTHSLALGCARVSDRQPASPSGPGPNPAPASPGSAASRSRRPRWPSPTPRASRRSRSAASPPNSAPGP